MVLLNILFYEMERLATATATKSIGYILYVLSVKTAFKDASLHFAYGHFWRWKRVARCRIPFLFSGRHKRIRCKRPLNLLQITWIIVFYRSSHGLDASPESQTAPHSLDMTSFADYGPHLHDGSAATFLFSLLVLRFVLSLSCFYYSSICREQARPLFVYYVS